MRKNLRFVGSFFLLLVLITAAIFMTGCASKPPVVTGTCVTTAEPKSDKMQQWVSEDGLMHLRDGLVQYRCTFNDERLNGDWFSTVNFDADALTFAGMYYGYNWINGEDGKTAWEGAGHGNLNQAGDFSSTATYYGRGKFEGFQAVLNISRAKGAQEYKINGDILPIKK